MFFFVFFFRKKVKRLSASQNNTPFRFLFTRLWSKIRASTFFIWHLLLFNHCTLYQPYLANVKSNYEEVFFFLHLFIWFWIIPRICFYRHFFADSFCFTVKEQKEIIRNINWIKLNIMIFAVSTRFCLYKKDYITQH